MAEVLLAFGDVGLAVRVQEALEAAGHHVQWDQSAPKTGTPKSSTADLIVFTESVDRPLGPLVAELRSTDAPPALLLVGSDVSNSEAGKFRIDYLDASSDTDAFVSAAEKSIALRFASKMTTDYALGALRIPPGDRGESDMLRIVTAAREADLSVVREALRWHMLDYVVKTEKIDQLREHRALQVPEIELLKLIDGCTTVKWTVDRGADPTAAARLIWALTSVGALTLTSEPNPHLSPQCRAIFEMRKHLRARAVRLQTGTLFDVLETAPSAPEEELQQAIRSLSVRYSPKLLKSMDLGAFNSHVDPTIETIEKAYGVLRDLNSRAQYAIALTKQQGISGDSWARKHDSEAASVAYTKGQRALLAGEVFEAVSHMAAAARFHPSHPVYETSLAWARYRADVTRGGDRNEIAVRERQIAELALMGRRVWPQALVALGLLCVASGDAESARWHLKEALNCDPNLPAATQLMAKLK